MAPLAAVLRVVLSKAEDACASVRKKKITSVQMEKG